MVLENTEIRPYCNDDLRGFTDIFTSYFRNDFKITISDEKVKNLCSRIAQSSISGITPLDILLLDDKIIGFVNYQIDTPDSDWCEREGWGFIREIYVDKTLRGKGLGYKLVAHAQKNLYTDGVDSIYLTSDEEGEFWESCGYKYTGRLSQINYHPIYEK